MKRKLTLLTFLRYFAVILLSYLPSMLIAQPVKQYPQRYFRWPLNLPPEIVANMGELRDNHWHMGLDVRTNQKVNQPVYAAAEGYIAYAGIRPLSFGRFIIINHPNGLSTLYGHLNDFFPALEAYVTAQQYQQESWAVELEIPKNKFPVSKGTFIAYSGSTGGSQGPHVHFEIRDTKSGKCLNPLLFGFPLADNVPPSMVKLALYDRTRSVYEQSPRFFALKKTGDQYIIPQTPVLKTGTPRFSFALQAYDRINGTLNQDGIYTAKLFLDNQLQVGFVIDSIDYSATRYMNAQIDYKYHENGGAFIQHLSRMPGDHGGIYHPVLSDGVVELADADEHTIKIEITDAYGNSSVLQFRVQYDGNLNMPFTIMPNLPVLSPNQENVFRKPDFEAIVPGDCLYDSVRIFYSRDPSIPADAVSALHRLNDETIPLHSSLTVRIKPDKPIPGEWKNKLVIRRTWRDRTSSRPAKIQDNQWLSAEFGDFGMFQAFVDLTPPALNGIGTADTVNLSAASRIVFTPTDNSGIKSFRAELDDGWLRFTNDKGRSWIYVFDQRCPYGVHKLKVTVEDIVGNVTVKTWWFKKYPYTPPPKKKVVKKKVSSQKKKKRKK